MKKLKYYTDRNLTNVESVFGYLMDTLSESIFTWDYFVDFPKITYNIDSMRNELLELNSLLESTEDTIDNDFLSIIRNHPKIRKVLPILVALRQDALKKRPIINNIENMVAESKDYLFNTKIPLNVYIEEELSIFFKTSGLRDLFSMRKISNIIDYAKGIEVGMDTNARKNRTGESMENIVESHLKDFCDETGFQYMEQATAGKLLYDWDVTIQLDKISRRFDFALYSPDQRLYFIETNYYGGGGSKLKATAGEYQSLEKFLHSQGHEFIWITDGLGWKTARTALEEAFHSNDYIFNLEMITNGILKDAVID